MDVYRIRVGHWTEHREEIISDGLGQVMLSLSLFGQRVCGNAHDCTRAENAVLTEQIMTPSLPAA